MIGQISAKQVNSTAFQALVPTGITTLLSGQSVTTPITSGVISPPLDMNPGFNNIQLLPVDQNFATAICSIYPGSTFFNTYAILQFGITGEANTPVYAAVDVLSYLTAYSVAVGGTTQINSSFASSTRQGAGLYNTGTSGIICSLAGKRRPAFYGMVPGNYNTDGLLLTNPLQDTGSIYTYGNPQNSPTIHLQGNGYSSGNGNGNELVDWQIYGQVQDSAGDPTGILIFQSQTNGNGYNVNFQITTGGMIATNSNVFWDLQGYNGTTAVNVNVSGVKYALTASAVSDEKIKKNIYPYVGGLDIVDKIKPIKFNFIDEYRTKYPQIKDRDYVGFSANQLEKVLPDSVSFDEVNQLKTIDKVSLIPYLVSAIKELKAEIGELKAEIKRNK